jgi:hypothetical protein
LNYYEKENKNSNNFHVLLIRNEHFWVPIADFWRESDEKNEETNYLERKLSQVRITSACHISIELR